MADEQSADGVSFFICHKAVMSPEQVPVLKNRIGITYDYEKKYL
ncbi:hypothetical protein [Oribacterium sp. P6A1]|nr:hypothetical protein [Oribacterium sp. P6A1]